jgi:hypothetical protein
VIVYALADALTVGKYDSGILQWNIAVITRRPALTDVAHSIYVMLAAIVLKDSCHGTDTKPHSGKLKKDRIKLEIFWTQPHPFGLIYFNVSRVVVDKTLVGALLPFMFSLTILGLYSNSPLS